ncbi:hypothetical protein ACFO3O_06175 [Dokdonia ponticola]|uniref:DUF4833 domain-containing protein n=1 Tax=Dokdonia ponticola TaxID=2041041 RepID=A0ABV9HW20_9FLAO
MKKITLFILLISSSIFSQTIKEDNTLIILFEEEQGSHTNYNKDKSVNSIFYNIPLDEGNSKDTNDPFYQTNKVSFVYKVFKDFDTAFRKDSTFVIKVDKSFIKNNEDIILTKDDFNKMDRLKLFLKLDQNRSKNIFLINKNEIKDSKLLMRQVDFFYVHSE